MTKVPHHPSVEATQLVRIRNVWLAAQPRPDEVQRAYRRWSSPVTRATRRVSASWLLAVAALLFGGGALAITGAFALQRSAPATSPSVAASRSLPSMQQMGKRRPSPRTVEAPAALGTHAEEAASKSNVPPTTSMASSPERAIPQSTGGARSAKPSAGPIASATASGADAVAVPASESGSWSRVAAAMREGDPQRVNAALELLRGSDDAATRDVARLTQAQLDIANSNTEPARTELRSLAETGATPLVRHRAQALLQRISE